jgi:hypothetical protein
MTMLVNTLFKGMQVFFWIATVVTVTVTLTVTVTVIVTVKVTVTVIDFGLTSNLAL